MEEQEIMMKAEQGLAEMQAQKNYLNSVFKI